MGLYQETVVAYEVVLGDGSVITVTADNEHSDLYYCLPWSHGTLGFLASLELKIIKIKPYVHMKYIPVIGGFHQIYGGMFYFRFTVSRSIAKR